MRVPFPAARIRMWRSKGPQLSRCFGFERAPAVAARYRRRIQGAAERIVTAKGLEVGIGTREPAVFGIQRDRAFEMRNRFGRFTALRVRDGQHVESVIVIGIFVANESQVGDSLIVLATVDRKR